MALSKERRLLHRPVNAGGVGASRQCLEQYAIVYDVLAHQNKLGIGFEGAEVRIKPPASRWQMSRKASAMPK